MKPETLRLPADRRFWPAFADAALAFAQRHGLAGAQLHRLTIVLPQGAHAPLARAALAAALGAPGAWLPPRLATLGEWAGALPDEGTVARRAELFAALRMHRWVRENFGDRPAALWALAREIAALADELTLAAVDDPHALAQRFAAALARHYRQRAARALQPQAQLVLELWRALHASADESAADAATLLLRALRRRAEQAAAPLVYVADEALAGWQRAFVERYAQGAPVLVVEADCARALAARPLLAAAWPELAGGEDPLPIAQRAAAIGGADAGARPAIVAAHSLEEEAAAVAQRVLDWLGQGVAAIALVALDRLTARRVRALLERAQVGVRDETGWKLSTTSAAAAVMRWYDLVADDVYWRDLLDWLKSTFTFAGRPRKAHELAVLERAVRAGGALQGARAMRRALADFAARSAGAAGHGRIDDVAGARELLALIEQRALAARRAGPALVAHVRALQDALEALGMRAALALDPVGAAVLREIDALEAELANAGGRATLAEFRALLAARFEEIAFVDRQVDSPVVMLSLAATSLRSFDAALLIGADAQHLPSAPAELLFLSNAVRAELGLATADDALRAQAVRLATLLAATPRVAATWRVRRGDEPNAPSPLLARLQFVARHALGDDLQRTAPRAAFEVDAAGSLQPAPSAPGLLAASVSASQAQSLVDCAYQFYARRLLGLAELDDVIEMPDKRDFGEALHEILRRFHQTWGAADFAACDRNQLAASLREHARTVFAPQIERTPGLLAFQRRFDGLVGGYVDWLQAHCAQGWRWCAAEHRQTQPLELRDGRRLELVGRIDRIDAQADGRTLVLDYKARRADDLKSSLKTPGEDVQLPFYGLLLARRPAAAAYLSFERATEDDSGIEPVEPPQPFAELVDAVGARLRSDLQRVADGAPLPAIGVRSVCERCEMRGLCRRDYWEHQTGESRERDE